MFRVHSALPTCFLLCKAIPVHNLNMHPGQSFSWGGNALGTKTVLAMSDKDSKQDTPRTLTFRNVACTADRLNRVTLISNSLAHAMNWGHDMGGCKTSGGRKLLSCDPRGGWKAYQTQAGPKPLFGRGVLREVFLPPPFPPPPWHSLSECFQNLSRMKAPISCVSKRLHSCNDFSSGSSNSLAPLRSLEVREK